MVFYESVNLQKNHTQAGNFIKYPVPVVSGCFFNNVCNKQYISI